MGNLSVQELQMIAKMDKTATVPANNRALEPADKFTNVCAIIGSHPFRKEKPVL
jgi:hypothetical protein